MGVGDAINESWLEVCLQPICAQIRSYGFFFRNKVCCGRAELRYALETMRS